MSRAATGRRSLDWTHSDVLSLTACVRAPDSACIARNLKNTDCYSVCRNASGYLAGATEQLQGHQSHPSMRNDLLCRPRCTRMPDSACSVRNLGMTESVVRMCRNLRVNFEMLGRFLEQIQMCPSQKSPQSNVLSLTACAIAPHSASIVRHLENIVRSANP